MTYVATVPVTITMMLAATTTITQAGTLTSATVSSSPMVVVSWVA